jgi:uncharacterized protein YceK
MKHYVVSLVMLLGLLAMPFAASTADHAIWHSPLTASTGTAELTIEPGSPTTTIRVTTDQPGDYQWVQFGLVLPSSVVIDSVILCYELASPGSFISQIRLTRTTTPDVAYVFHDDGTDLTDPGPACYSSYVGGAPIGATITLALRLNFASTQDWIDIGGIAICVSPGGSAVGEDWDSGELRPLMLKQNQPNPFGPSTIIEYDLEMAEQVELRILDATGRVVRSLARGEQAQGNHRYVWDGSDDAGREVSSGNYYYQVRVGDAVGSRGMVLLR